MRQLATQGLTIERLDPGWLIRLLSVITDPNVAFILLMVGIYGLIFEFSTPGAIAPGVVGTICLAARPLCPQHAADQLHRPRLDAAGDRLPAAHAPSAIAAMEAELRAG